MLEQLIAPWSDWGLVILRIALGITFLVHGWLKLNTNGPLKGPAGFGGFLRQLGVPLPLFFGWLVMLLETVGAVLLILGLGTRILALGLAIDMLVAIVLVKKGVAKASFMDAKSQGWEFEFALLAQSLALVFTGSGEIGLDSAWGL